MSKYISSGAVRFITGTLMILAFLVGLFAAGMAVFASVKGISYAEAWQVLWAAMQALSNK